MTRRRDPFRKAVRGVYHSPERLRGEVPERLRRWAEERGLEVYPQPDCEVCGNNPPSPDCCPECGRPGRCCDPDVCTNPDHKPDGAA